MKPIIYENSMDGLQFLNELEIAYLHTGSPEIVKMLEKRAAMMLALHNAWIEYDKKTGELKRLNRDEWKHKVTTILQLQFAFKRDQHKGIIDNYFTKVEYPKGGLLK